MSQYNLFQNLHVGGAITILSDADEEYGECLLKAESVLMAAK